jgi:lipooligosaccharide transport system permease protein
VTDRLRDGFRFVPIYRRNFLVWKRLAPASLVGNVIEPLITLLAFGYGLGSLMRTIEGVPYIAFLAAGSLCMSAAMASSFESLYSAFSRMHVQKTWESLLNAPLILRDILLAEWLWAASKGLLSGLAIVLVAALLDISRTPMMLLTVPVIATVGLCFAAMGLVVNAVARSYDFFNFYFTLVLMPMIFVSGVYYPVSQLPTWLAGVAGLLPLAAAVDLARPLFLGQWPDAPLRSLAILSGWTLGALWLASRLTARRLRV